MTKHNWPIIASLLVLTTANVLLTYFIHQGWNRENELVAMLTRCRENGR